jgi:hypothetical protein
VKRLAKVVLVCVATESRSEIYRERDEEEGIACAVLAHRIDLGAPPWPSRCMVYDLGWFVARLICCLIS